MKWTLFVCDGADKYQLDAYTQSDDPRRYPLTDENGWYRAETSDGKPMLVQKRFVVLMEPAEEEASE